MKPSVNHLQSHSYITPSGEIHNTPTFMRIGRSGSFLDNAHADGIYIGINEDGSLNKRAYTVKGETFEKHPDSGVEFGSYKVENFDLVLNKAKELHAMIPQLGIVNWDFTIGEDEKPILIEENTYGGGIWAPQVAHGRAAFGEDTDEILEFLRDRREKK